SVSNSTDEGADSLTVWIYVDGDVHYEHYIAFLNAGEVYELPGISDVGFYTVGWHLIKGQLDPYGSGPSIPAYAWPDQPDAVAAVIYFSDNSPLTNQEIGITGLIRNMGGVPFGGDSLGVAFYDSLEEVISEIWYGDVLVPLPCGGSTAAILEHGFSPAGDHIIRMFADPDSEYVEWDETNNTLDRLLPVRDPRPDFVVTYDGVTAEDPLASPGDSISFLAEIWNLGETSYEDTVLVRFKMDDSALTPLNLFPDGIPMDSARVCTSAAYWSGEWATEPDSHMLRVKVDPADEIPEINEFNNSAECRVPVDFEVRPIDACEMFQDTRDPDCDRILEWHEVQLHARVWNLGCFPAHDSIAVRFYDIFGSPPVTTHIASAWIEGLEDHKDEASVHVDHQFIERGLHEVLVWVDEDSTWDGNVRWAEYTRTNNTFSRQVWVVGEYPDITLNSEHINPSLLTPGIGDSVTVTATVFNTGLAVADSFDVCFNIDSTSLGDPVVIPFLGYNPDGHPPNYVSLEADSIWVIDESDCGPHAIWIITDCDSALVEMDEDNNEATRIILVCEDVPDLYVPQREFTVTPIGQFDVGVEPATGHSFWLEAVVHNSGGRAAAATAAFEYKIPREDWRFIGNEPIYVTAQGQDSVRTLWEAPVDECQLRVTISGTEPPELNYANNTTIVNFKSGEIVEMDTPDIEAPRLTMLYQNAPNPFRPSTTIRFDLPDTRKVSLKIYDVQGRLVRTLMDSRLPGGQYALRWDGKSDSRYMVGAGVYFCRMVAGGYERTLKMVQIK
ncbi:CARDB domain-containing protein, partial [Candidatus Eisenbacteria bacterium]